MNVIDITFIFKNSLIKRKKIKKIKQIHERQMPYHECSLTNTHIELDNKKWRTSNLNMFEYWRDLGRMENEAETLIT